MNEVTMCGYRCDLCKAFVPNIHKRDQRKELSAAWRKYYNLDVAVDDIYCDGCRCENSDAKRIDMNCPVRACVLQKGLDHCGDCCEYPCDIFSQREGLCFSEAKAQQGRNFNENEYNEYLFAFDNKTNLDEYVKTKRKK